ncbi:hypothetical protein GSF70_01310 [Flavobacteriaceae bacterium W22]|nr:hypothetical protein [Flavobacteriaceae bacterium W22]
MKADVQYNDFVGTAAADISDYLGTKFGDDIESIGKYFNIDTSRFQVLGLSLYGVESKFISLFCLDKIRSKKGNDFITKMSVPIQEEDKNDILEILFKRLHIVLHSKFDDRFEKLDYNEESHFEDFHETNE